MIVVLAATASCGGSTLRGSTGTGGVAGTSAAGAAGAGGTSAGGTGGTGATGGFGSDEAQVPRCLADLVAPCTCKSAGECGPQTCFKQGITVTTAAPDGGACNLTGESAETRVFNTDGSLCYSVRTASYTGRACEDLTISWWDAAGHQVASASGYPSFTPLRCYTATPTVTCTSTGDTGVVSINWPHTDCPTACP